MTALYPWLPAPTGAGDRQRAAQVASAVPPIPLTLVRLERFEQGVLFLALDEATERRVRDLTRRLTTAYPACVPYGGEHPDPRPHLTVAVGAAAELDAVERDVTAAGGAGLPLRTRVDALTLMEQRPDGTWRRACALPLGRAADPPVDGAQPVHSGPP